MPVITLTTDFGYRDHYVAAMKGIILQIAPNATIVDVSHGIEPGDTLSTAFVLREVVRSFPAKTVHVVVVDPGVGTDRNVILAQYADQLFLAPDNGVITMVHRMCPVQRVNVVTNATLFCQPVAATFHGRDILAPVAAHLMKGIKPEQVGPVTDFVNLLDVSEARVTDQGRLTGEVIYIDRFGNLITNISEQQLRGFASELGGQLQVHVGQKAVGSIKMTFADAQVGQPLAYMGSAGLVEIAVNQARADEHFNVRRGSAVEVG